MSSKIGSEHDLDGLMREARAEERAANTLVRIRYGHLKHGVLGSAIKEFEDTTSVVLPWNLNKVDQWIGIEKIDESKDRHPREQVQEIVRSCTQLAGWLRAAAELPAVTRLVSRTQSPNGMGSPYTTMYLWGFVAKNPSPGRLERQLWKVKRRAQQILSAWDGEHHPSWASVANALCITKSIGKAAVIVAAEALTDPRDDWDGSYRGIGNYQAARDLLVSIRSARFPVADNSDSVNARREEEPTLVKLGCQVYRIRLTDQYGRYSLQWLVTGSSRTYHSSEWNAREALREALRAWKEQDKLQAIEDAKAAGGAKRLSVLTVDELFQEHGYGVQVKSFDPVDGVAALIFKDDDGNTVLKAVPTEKITGGNNIPDDARVHLADFSKGEVGVWDGYNMRPNLSKRTEVVRGTVFLLHEQVEWGTDKGCHETYDRKYVIATPGTVFKTVWGGNGCRYGERYNSGIRYSRVEK